MATGYTCFIEDGKITTAKGFLLLCARAFGACIEMRDEPLSEPIPEKFNGDDTYRLWLEDAKTKLSKLKALSQDEVHAANEAEYRKHVDRWKAGLKEREEKRQAYLSVLDGVQKWTPPTQDHEGVKIFALDQINMCLKDLQQMDKFTEEPVKESDEEWLSTHIKYCEYDIRRYEQQVEEEEQRTASRNLWLRELRESLDRLEE